MSKFFRIFIALFILAVSAHAVNVLEKVSFSDNQFVLDFKDGLSAGKIKHFVLDNPRREAYDFYDTRISNRLDTSKAPKGCGIVIAQNSASKVRAVIYNALDSANISQNSYMISVKPNSLSTTPVLSSSKTQNKNTDSISKKQKDNNIAQPTIAKQQNDNFDIDGQIIVVDPGHGGKDPGAMSGGKKEKDATLAVALKLASALKNRGFKVYLTRDSDVFITLRDRTKIADQKHAKLFISLHCNATGDENFHGIESFFLQNSKDKASQAIAMRENESVLQGTNQKDKNVIINAVLNGPKIVLSNKLAIDVQNSVVGSMGIRDEGVRSAPFWVLVGASRPSILVEMGYITNPGEREKLFDDNYQSKLANSIANGVVRYLKNQQAEVGF